MHAAFQLELSTFGRRARQQHFRVECVVVVAGRTLGLLPRTTDHIRRNTLILKVGKICHKLTLAQHVLAARQIAQPPVGHRPPGPVVSKFGADVRFSFASHGPVAGNQLQIGLMDPLMEHHPRQPITKRQISNGFDLIRITHKDV